MTVRSSRTNNLAAELSKAIKQGQMESNIGKKLGDLSTAKDIRFKEYKKLIDKLYDSKKGEVFPEFLNLHSKLINSLKGKEKSIAERIEELQGTEKTNEIKKLEGDQTKLKKLIDGEVYRRIYTKYLQLNNKYNTRRFNQVDRLIKELPITVECPHRGIFRDLRNNLFRERKELSKKLGVKTIVLPNGEVRPLKVLGNEQLKQLENRREPKRKKS